MIKNIYSKYSEWDMIKETLVSTKFSLDIIEIVIFNPGKMLTD